MTVTLYPSGIKVDFEVRHNGKAVKAAKWEESVAKLLIPKDTSLESRLAAFPLDSAKILAAGKAEDSIEVFAMLPDGEKVARQTTRNSLAEFVKYLQSVNAILGLTSQGNTIQEGKTSNLVTTYEVKYPSQTGKKSRKAVDNAPEYA